MATSEQLEKHLSLLFPTDFARKLEKKKIATLESSLREDENLLALTKCKLGMLAITDTRVIYVGISIQDFPYAQIGSIEHTKAFLGSEISIFIGGRKTIIPGIAKEKVQEISDLIRAQIAAHHKGANQSPTKGTDVADQLVKLAALRDQGILTDEEFAQQKAKLLQ
ncbi:MAG: PH domain-containing protein [bacterium]